MWFDAIDAQFAGLQLKLQREMQRQRLNTFKVDSTLICQTNLFPSDMGEKPIVHLIYSKNIMLGWLCLYFLALYI